MFFFQAEDGIRDLVRSRGLGDVYKRQFQKGRKIRPIKITKGKIPLKRNKINPGRKKFENGVLPK